MYTIHLGKQMESKFFLRVTEALPAGVKPRMCCAGLLGRRRLSQSQSIYRGHLWSPSKQDLGKVAAVQEGLGRDAESDALPSKKAANKCTQAKHEKIHRQKAT